MVEIDSDTYQVRKMHIESKSAPLRFLITQERSQNLELLQHLLANTRQAVVLCGPDGVGKTALLEVLRQRLKEDWRWCGIDGRGGTTFEEIHDRVGPLLRHPKSETHIPAKNKPQDIHKNVVLVIDDAGEIPPGLLTRFIRFSENHQDLRLLFVLTHDQWHIKNLSDPALENCHIVEAKPLLQKECRDFVQHLASLTTSLRLGKGITDGMMEAVYQSSHGIPARIIAYFPALKKPRDSTDPLTILIVAVLCLVSLALYTQWSTSSRPSGEGGRGITQPGTEEAYLDFQSPVISLPGDDLLKYSHRGEEQAAYQDARQREPFAAPPKPELTPTEPLPPATADKAAGEAAKGQDAGTLPPDPAQLPPSPGPGSPETAGEDAASWLAAQPENNYALQLMVLSKESTGRNVIARHHELQERIRIVRRHGKNREKFVLLYGNFADIESAKNAKTSLPAEFKAALIRKFGAIRKEFPSAPEPYKPDSTRTRTD